MVQLLNNILNYLSNLPQNIEILLAYAGNYTYVLLWLNMFLETGGVVFGFLPGNSVLLAAAAFAANSDKVHIGFLFILFFTATLAGDTSSFFIGRYLGKKYTTQNRIQFINKEQFDAAHDYFELHGRQTFIISRFIPVFRGIMPLAAGFTQVSFRRIFPYSLIGVILWNITYLALGYFFGNIPMIRNNFSLIIFVIVLVTMIPTFYVVWHNYKKFKATLSAKPSEVHRSDESEVSPESPKNDFNPSDVSVGKTGFEEPPESEEISVDKIIYSNKKRPD